MKRLETAGRQYEKSLALNPPDDGYQHNPGWLYSFLQIGLSSYYEDLSNSLTP